jgi:hypothetical protein
MVWVLLPHLTVPRGITIDASYATLYVSEVSGHRLRSITLSTSQVQTIAGSGTASYVDGYGTAAAFNGPLHCSHNICRRHVRSRLF